MAVLISEAGESGGYKYPIVFLRIAGVIACRVTVEDEEYYTVFALGFIDIYFHFLRDQVLWGTDCE